jgi:hypothetical protein
MQVPARSGDDPSPLCHQVFTVIHQQQVRAESRTWAITSGATRTSAASDT